MSRRAAVTATQAAATKAEAAADALLVWLQTQPTRSASQREATDPATERGEPLAGRPATDLCADVVEPDPLVAAAAQPEQPDLAGVATAAGPSPNPIRRERLAPPALSWPGDTFHSKSDRHAVVLSCSTNRALQLSTGREYMQTRKGLTALRFLPVESRSGRLRVMRADGKKDSNTKL
jgi:hypothetical protein